ncbi:hypothetical protein [Rhodococcus indonesiensis]
MHAQFTCGRSTDGVTVLDEQLSCSSAAVRVRSQVRSTVALLVSGGAALLFGALAAAAQEPSSLSVACAMSGRDGRIWGTTSMEAQTTRLGGGR